MKHLHVWLPILFLDDAAVAWACRDCRLICQIEHRRVYFGWQR